MKLAIALENTKMSKEFLDTFINKTSFLKNYELMVYTVMEFEEQEEEINELETYVFEILKKHKINFNFIIEKGDPVYRISENIKKQKVDMVVSSYEHTVFKNSFFEELIDLLEMPVLVLK